MNKLQSVRRAEVPVDIETHDYLDACRGYAILLVIISHVFNSFANMPWHIRRFTDLGWNGVQLFFVVSSLTLAMSWQRRARQEQAPALTFLIRRFFRIAPMFYGAFVLYLFLSPPGARFSWAQAAATLMFAHGWSPSMVSTVPHGWIAVPGSWSIAVEFAFYLAFPVLIDLLTTARRSTFAFILSLPVAFGLDKLAMHLYTARYGWTAADQFVFYWLPNQMPVFCLGFLMYHVLRKRPKVVPRETSVRNTLLSFSIVASFCSLAMGRFPRTPQMTAPFVPIHIAAALIFCMFIYLLATSTKSSWTNWASVALGKVSFGAYLLHFGVIQLGMHLFRTNAAPIKAAASGIALLLLVLCITYMLAYVAHILVEQPMIAVGRKLAKQMERSLNRRRDCRRATSLNEVTCAN